MMSEADLRILQSGTETDLDVMIKRFNATNENVFTFPDLKPDTKERCVEGLLSRLEWRLAPPASVSLLQAVCILSRDKANMDGLVSDRALGLLVRLAGIEQYAVQHGESVSIQSGNQDVMIGAQKCLYNLILNSPVAQVYCSKGSCVDGVVQRMKTYGNSDLKFNVKLFDMRILFLLTALPTCVETRVRVRYSLHGFVYLVEVLRLTLRDCDLESRPLSDQDVDLCNNILKILFNLTMSQENKSADEVSCHTVNLLINIPVDFYEELLSPLSEEDVRALESRDFECGKNMEAIVSLLDLLQSRLDTPAKNNKEKLLPTLCFFIQASEHNRSIRKFCKSKVLPPMKSEEWHTLGNRLCKLLASPVKDIKDLVTYFIFILCKKNVQRMAKYIGYIDCPCLLALLGLMSLDEVNTWSAYSSASEDSGTKE